MSVFFGGLSTTAVLAIGFLVVWLTSVHPKPGQTMISRSRFTSAVRMTAHDDSVLPTNWLLNQFQGVLPEFSIEIGDLSASGQHGSRWSLLPGETTTVTARVHDPDALRRAKMCAGPDDFTSAGVCKHAQVTIEGCLTRLWREFIASQTATMVVGLDIKAINEDMLQNMTRECPYPGIGYKVVSVSKPHAPDDDDDERAAYALKRPIYEAAAEANRSIAAAQSRTEIMLAETRAAVAAVEANAQARAMVSAANTTAAIKVIEANATLQAATAEANALLVLAEAEVEAETARANQRTDEFQSRLEAVSRLLQRMEVKPDAHGLAEVVRAATWAHRPGATLLSEGQPMPLLRGGELVLPSNATR